MNSSSAFEIRGPQRRRKESNSEDNQPLFLKKCYHMISTCPPDIASWSQDGQSFIIFDVNRFSSEIIPTVYKHNKFPSFVRQLNFYGFRKVRSELPQHANYWEFKHPLFRQGDVAALSQIKKSAHFDESSTGNQVASMSENVNELKSHVWTLTQRVSNLDAVVEDLSRSFHNLSHHSSVPLPATTLGGRNQATASQANPYLPMSSYQNQGALMSNTASASASAPVLKRKISGHLSRQSSAHLQVGDFEEEFWDFASTLSLENIQFMTGGDGSSASVEGDFSEATSDLMAMYGSGSSVPSSTSEMHATSASLAVSSTGLFSGFAAELPSSAPSSLPFVGTSTVPVSEEVRRNEEVATAMRRGEELIDRVAMEDIPTILKLLPESLQGRFVDRLAEAVGSRLSRPAAESVPPATVNASVNTTATATATPVATRPYWETLAIPSAAPLSSYLTSQSDLPSSFDVSSFPAQLWTPSVPPSVVPPAVDQYQGRLSVQTQRLLSGSSSSVYGAIGGSQPSAITGGDLAMTALATQLQLAATALHQQGRLHEFSAAVVTDPVSAPTQMMNALPDNSSLKPFSY